ncbi:MAG: hypothetical protein AAGA60_14795 [Cyanobacteria bacterium P01_E01_bin.42]
MTRKLHNRYPDKDLARAINLVKMDAERLGIEFKNFPDRQPALFVDRDNQNSDNPLPESWQSLLNEQADRIGFELLC